MIYSYTIVLLYILGNKRLLIYFGYWFLPRGVIIPHGAINFWQNLPRGVIIRATQLLSSKE